MTQVDKPHLWGKSHRKNSRVSWHQFTIPGYPHPFTPPILRMPGWQMSREEKPGQCCKTYRNFLVKQTRHPLNSTDASVPPKMTGITEEAKAFTTKINKLWSEIVDKKNIESLWKSYKYKQKKNWQPIARSALPQSHWSLLLPLWLWFGALVIKETTRQRKNSMLHAAARTISSCKLQQGCKQVTRPLPLPSQQKKCTCASANNIKKHCQ